ncbi:hypothetical protein UFOVP253_27 [uncultured Caudovirales phage]|uniref:Uncharacterized protein n=1 Tax=uncultured Caudovirales phage TaxID=2100421 RepID=A0A6J5LLD3_9CAUD|nr:hypothetical protein UFOVP253_27 [uncultured Caudovirales phage]
MHPINDKIKVKITKDEYGFGGEKVGVEKGVVVEIPEDILYLGFHSFAFEDSLMGNTANVQAFYNKLKGKLVFWESLQDRGRRFKENDEEFVFLNMTDIIAYSNDLNINVEIVDQTGQAGSFNLS